MKRPHCTYIDTQTGARRTWYTDRLWTLAADLPIKSVPIESIPAFDQNTWFHQTEPTCRHIAEHARRIYETTLDHPIILAAEGWVMDGMHRICKAFILGHPTIQAVQFIENPAPDESADTTHPINPISTSPHDQ